MNKKKKDRFQHITEGETKLFVYPSEKDNKGPGKKQGLPFYNPSMEMNRDISITILQHLVDTAKQPIFVLDGLASSGIRGVRFLHEVDGQFHVTINDWSDEAFFLIKKNTKGISKQLVTRTHANIHTLLAENHYHYIDIDPFGSPAPYIDSALRSIKNNGIIALTATDTATLCSVYPIVCNRRYNAIPIHGPCMHEVGLRILIGFIGRQAGKYDKGINPIFSYSSDHYMRSYIQINKSVKKANETQEQISLIPANKIPGQKKQSEKGIGPLWVGTLHNQSILQKIKNITDTKTLNTKKQMMHLYDICLKEAAMPPFYFSTNTLSKTFKTSPPSREVLFQHMMNQGYAICQTQFDPTGFKTDASSEIVEDLFLHITRKK